MGNNQNHSDLFSGLVTSEELRQQYLESGWLVSIPISVVSSHWLFTGEQRLDGGYYSQEAVAAQLLVNDCGFRNQELRKLVSDLFILGRFKRIYATDKTTGWEYLSASEALSFRPSSDEWLAKDQAPKEAQRHFAKQGWLLISASGSVGRLTLATERLEKFFLTHDLIRVVPSINVPIGYLYALLSTGIGQALIVKDQYGAAIKHLEPHHVAGVPIPLIPDNEQNLIHEAITKAFSLRDESNELLDKADELLHTELGLPKFDESLVPYLTAPQHNTLAEPNLPHPKAFSIKASDLEERFDGSYHVPTAKLAIEKIKSGKYKPTQLSKFLTDIFLPNRFKRIYVNKEFGVPFLQGSHLPMMRPYDLKYVSKRANEKNIEQCLIHEGNILLTRSGTIGRIGLVSSRLDGWVASEHLLRLITNTAVAHPGYLAAFLLTPYGQHQIIAKTYGGVVDEITADDTSQVWITDAPKPIQEKIGKLVVEAFEKKDEARAIEEAAIKQLEHRLEEAAKIHKQ